LALAISLTIAKKWPRNVILKLEKNVCGPGQEFMVIALTH